MKVNFAPVNGAITRFGYRFVQMYWRITRPLTLGVFGICLDADRRVVLVKQTYRLGWFLPGGGVEKGESVIDALKMLGQSGLRRINRTITGKKSSYVPKAMYPIIHSLENDGLVECNRLNPRYRIYRLKPAP